MLKRCAQVDWRIAFPENARARAQGITCNVTSVPDNAGCVALLSAKPSGVLPILDATCKEPGPTDEKFISSLHRAYSKKPAEGSEAAASAAHFAPVHPRLKRDSFAIAHYAGEVGGLFVVRVCLCVMSRLLQVLYTAVGWIEANADQVPSALLQLAGSSTSKMLSSLVADEV